jgi:hypothetical protein
MAEFVGAALLPLIDRAIDRLIGERLDDFSAWEDWAMARTWKASRAPDAPRAPTTIHEIARRYHACAVALAQTLGLAVAEVLREHRESVTAVFIECGRSDLRLAANIQLPPLVAPEPQSHGDRGEGADVTAVDHQPTSVPHDGQDGKARSAIAEHATGDSPLPSRLPS